MYFLSCSGLPCQVENLYNGPVMALPNFLLPSALYQHPRPPPFRIRQKVPTTIPPSHPPTQLNQKSQLPPSRWSPSLSSQPSPSLSSRPLLPPHPPSKPPHQFFSLGRRTAHLCDLLRRRWRPVLTVCPLRLCRPPDWECPQYQQGPDLWRAL